LAFGLYAQFEDDYYYCAGFRNDEPGNRLGNTAVCVDDNDMSTYHWYQFYSVSETYFTAPADFEMDYTGYDYGVAYGLSAIYWGSVYHFTDFGDFYQADAFRFIG